MADHQKFNIKSLSDLAQLAGKLHLDIPEKATPSARWFFAHSSVSMGSRPSGYNP